MDNQLFDRYDPAGIEVLRRLEAYADARLTPTVDATVRVRAAVMEAANRRGALLATAAAIAAAGPARGRGCG